MSAAGAMAPGSEDGARRVDGDRGGGRGRGRVRWPRRSSVAGARVPGTGPSAEELGG